MLDPKRIHQIERILRQRFRASIAAGRSRMEAGLTKTPKPGNDRLNSSRG
jgi:hypothetical protein